MFKILKYRNEMRVWQKKFDASAPKVGEIAPDFELRDTYGENPVRLSDFKDKKPVGLIFGSFT
jgi:peroxiredoxin